ncbi:HesB/YadR/YfhF [Rubrobacter xylanophilus DSM 9941]|uniref:HesB/YadR/YfhF n=1 Tax=Rubrobacter xylanophilus (strain DSM 9941 / JCM 11954 / NBRC 16129 / PRD-1) TaxID=266117 RepID=Q1ASE2_RUBXD|nr:HesB/YadR/YfhF [Rubrobacter xylanophilus DSM 9941]
MNREGGGVIIRGDGARERSWLRHSREVPVEQKQAIVSITDKAAEKVRALMEQEGEEDLALRIGVRPGGCSGFQYSIYFDDEVAEDDEVFETKGVKILVDAMSVPYLMGSEFDWQESLMGAGFVVNNPNVQGSCGCGGSFTC